jgi:molybdate transport system ATP-binding protein
MAKTPMSIEIDIVTEQPVRVRAQLQCGAGQTLGLVGPSGAGKSTVLRAIAGLVEARGAIRVGGASWMGIPTQYRRVGLVAQSSNLLPHYSALENIAMPLSGSPSQVRARAQQWLERVNLNGLGHRLPHQLSGGQQQRVAIARALAREPDVLLLDEPFSSVDASTRRRLYEELQTVRMHVRCATILVTHDVKEAVLLADELCVIAGQQTLVQGDARVLLNSPPTGRIAQLLGWRNVVPAAHWAQSALLQRYFVASDDPQRCILIPHRGVRIQAQASAPGAVVANLGNVLTLPHQAWAMAMVDGVRIWGELDETLLTAKRGTQCFLQIETDRVRETPQ